MLITQYGMLAENAVNFLIPHVVVASQQLQRVAEATGGTDPIAGFLQYGVLGLVVVGFATGWLVSGSQMKAVQTENLRLQGVIEERLYPMIEKHAVTMDRVVSALDKTNEALERNNKLLDRFDHREAR